MTPLTYYIKIGISPERSLLQISSDFLSHTISHFKQALRRILSFLDHNNNHKIRLEDFIDIMDEHNVELDPEEVRERV